ncbi:MAG TPA: class I SAM-dependent methyltransferase [Stellaceae bacterium]|jgi:SAM-dependent methyltransferase|nr:class I SAM-dependent methyltransferase [Stellaceae bacterium]
MLVRKIYRALKPLMSVKTDIWLRQTRRNALSVIGYDNEDWIRVVRRAEWHGYLAAEARRHPDILEISPGLESPWAQYATGSYRGVEYPDFDITRRRLDRQFDVIIAEEVFEHLADADAAAENVHAMLKPDGVFLVSVPFLIKLHGPPAYGDFHRWSPNGLRVFLGAHGFSSVDAKSWGNAEAVIANFNGWKRYAWGRNLDNDPELPAAVWAYARP